MGKHIRYTRCDTLKGLSKYETNNKASNDAKRQWGRADNLPRKIKTAANAAKENYDEEKTHRSIERDIRALPFGFVLCLV